MAPGDSGSDRPGFPNTQSFISDHVVSTQPQFPHVFSGEVN